jgi:hypothetical protein
MTITPSASPTIISPGFTAVPPHEMGTLISPTPTLPLAAILFPVYILKL